MWDTPPIQHNQTSPPVGASLADHVLALAQGATRSTAHGSAVRSWGHGPALVLMHGGVGSWTHWVCNIEPLAARFRVHALDLPGFGDSPDVPGAASPDDYLDGVADAIRELVHGAAVRLAAFSFGAVVGAAVGRRLGTQLGALTLIGPGGFGEPVGREIPVQRRPRDRSDVHELRRVMAFNLGQWMLSRPPPFDDPVVDLHMSNVERSRYDSRRIGWRPTLLPDLQGTSAPTQIVWGDGDRLAHPSVHDRLERCREARADLHLSIVPNCGHWAMYERPEAINRLLLDFHSSAPGVPHEF